MGNEREGWHRFLTLCLKAKDCEALDALMGALLTPTERTEIAYRTLIFRELLQGKLSQRAIAETLPVSIAKVTRGSNMLKVLNLEVKSHLAS